MNTEAIFKPIARVGGTIRRLGIGLLVLGALYPHGTCAIARSADSSTEKRNRADSSSYRGGVIRVGAFVITDINSRIYFGPSDFPIAVSVDVEEDLGFKDSLVALRTGFSYRFSKHHAMSVGYYQLSTTVSAGTGSKSTVMHICMWHADFDQLGRIECRGT